MDAIQGGVRRPLRLTAALLASGLVWTGLIIGVSDLGFNLHLPRTRLAIETASATVALMTATIAFVRASVAGPRAWWFVGTAFLLLGLHRFVFGVVVAPGTLGAELAFYSWTAGRILAAALLATAGLSRFRGEEEPSPVLPMLVRIALPAVSVMAAIVLLLWQLRESLPALSSVNVDPGAVTGILPGLAAVVIVCGAIGAALFLVAAFLHLRPVEGRLVSSWLPPTLVLAALSQLHSTLAPATFSGNIATGDLLRLGFSLLLLIGIVHDVRIAYDDERRRSRQLAAAYAAERARVGEMESSERAREEFYNVLTHELMHPVATLRGLALTLDRRWDHLDEVTRREFVGRLAGETARLRDLAEGSMTTVHPQDDSFAIVPRLEQVADLVREVVEANPEMAPRLRVDVQDGADRATVVADRTRILQVMRNLLSNASKYSDRDAPIDLRVACSQEVVEFKVSDRGRGIPPESVPRAFQRFARIDSPRTRAEPGSGLGLYISKSLVEAHGGRIWIDTRPGEGTSVTFTLPREKVLQ